MRKSNSRCSPFRNCNRSTLILKKWSNFASACLIFFSQAGCKSRNVADATSSADAESSLALSSRPLMTIGESIKLSWIPLKVDTGEQGSNAHYWLGASSCIESSLQLKTGLASGRTVSDVLIVQPWNSTWSTVTVDGISHQVEMMPITAEKKSSICTAVDSSGVTVVLPTQLSEFFKSNLSATLKNIAPDCQAVEWDANGWACKLQTLMPQAAIVKLEEFQLGMTRKWSRQPYILARRAGVAMALARASTNLNMEVNLQKFCKLLQFSLPEELPLIMTSQRWRESLCEGNDAQKREVAFHGLAKAVEELVMIRKLYENTSKPGTLSIRIPDSEIPGRGEGGLQPFRVIFTPDESVTNRLIEVAGDVLGKQIGDSQHRPKKIVALNVDIGGADPLKQPCWHPFFSDSTNLFKIAEGMRLTGDGFTGSCVDNNVDQNLKVDTSLVLNKDDLLRPTNPLAQYLMQSLSSETEFVVDNGRSKLIRLPEGKYQYSIEVLPQNPVDTEEEVNENTAETRGLIQWGGLNHHTIKNWVQPIL